MKTVNTRQAGEISMPDKIYFENVEDYVKFIGKETEFLAFQKAARICRKDLPELQNFMAEQPLKVIKYLEIWQDLISIAAFFLDNPKPNLYPREIPVNIANATFIEENQAILTEILNAILSKDAIFETETIFEKRFGLKYEIPQIRVRSLSGNLANFPISDITLSLNDWQEINLTAETVFMITDKMNFLRFPEMPNAIAILATPKIIENLKEIIFLKNKKIYFWGDISLQSMEYLSAIRIAFPKVKSFLMTVELLEKYVDFVETKKVENTAIITHLTADEQAVLKEILEGKSLLQKVILQEDIEECLEDIS